MKIRNHDWYVTIYNLFLLRNILHLHINNEKSAHYQLTEENAIVEYYAWLSLAEAVTRLDTQLRHRRKTMFLIAQYRRGVSSHKNFIYPAKEIIIKVHSVEVRVKAKLWNNSGYVHTHGQNAGNIGADGVWSRGAREKSVLHRTAAANIGRQIETENGAQITITGNLMRCSWGLLRNQYWRVLQMLMKRPHVGGSMRPFVWQIGLITRYGRKYKWLSHRLVGETFRILGRVTTWRTTRLAMTSAFHRHCAS